LDDLMALAAGLGVLKALNAIPPQLTREGDIPRWCIPHALFWRTVVGDERLNAMQEGLCRDTGVLRLLGGTAREIGAGFDPQRHRGAHTPCDVDRLRYRLKQTATAHFYEALTRCRARWLKAGFSTRRGTDILDATKLDVDGEDEGAGEMTSIEAPVDAQGKRHRRQVVTQGFNLVTLASLVPKHKVLVVLADRLRPIPQHAVTVSEELIAAVATAMGAGAIRRLRSDRGCLDGERWGRWHTRGLDVVVPVKHNLAVLAARQGLAKRPVAAPIRGAERQEAKEAQGHPLDDVKVLGFRDVETLESSPGQRNGLLGRALRGRAVAPEHPWGAITTVPVRTPAAVLAAFDASDDRALVENAQYRDLTPGDRLPTFIGPEASAMAAQLFLEVLRYSVMALYQPQRAYRDGAEGSRRLRRVAWKQRLEGVVSVGWWSGLLAVREFAPVLGRPPTGRRDGTRVHLRPRRRP
jgi:hypothetical protein